MKKSYLIIALIFFIIGFFSSYAYATFSYNYERPFSFFNSERPSPSDFIKEGQIMVLPDRIIIFVQGALWSKYADTNSMDPLLDETANGIEIVPNCEDVSVGDVIAYNAKWTNGLIVHRVVNISEDDTGLYFRLKGDNSSFTDPERVRCDQIRYQLIGVLY